MVLYGRKIRKSNRPGHRRIKAMDLHYKYNGTPGTDYDVKVEVVNLDDKAEKEAAYIHGGRKHEAGYRPYSWAISLI